MAVMQFDREQLARHYARRHLSTDPGIQTVYYLPGGSPERDIRLLEINTMMAVRENDPLEPLDFGVEVGAADSHRLVVLDVTPSQWERIRSGELPLPEGWSLDGSIFLSRLT